MCLGAVGVTGTSAANAIAREADLVISIGCRLTDFTTASKSAFQNPDVRFININVAAIDAFKHAAIPVVADARVALQQLRESLKGVRTSTEYGQRIARLRDEWTKEADTLTAPQGGDVLTQAEVIGIVNDKSAPTDVVVCAAGSLPGELHKLWKARDSKGYHLEYGYSCMGYEIAGGLGVKMADPDRDDYVMVGDGSYLMMAQEIVTSVQEGCKLIIVLVDSGGFASIGALSRSVGSGGFGTNYRYRSQQTGRLDGTALPVDLAANAESLGARVFRASDRASLEHALDQARSADRTAVVYVQVDPAARVPGHGCWWDVPVSEVSEQDSVNRARREYETARIKQRWFV
jgi:3D-(3,5/4)-trihydroxycyclohexane-1,2-dione acylhydrolase (decyclizing)